MFSHGQKLQPAASSRSVLDVTTGRGCDATAFQTKSHLLYKIVIKSPREGRAKGCDRHFGDATAARAWQQWRSCTEAGTRRCASLGPVIIASNPHQELTLGSLLCPVRSHDCALCIHRLSPGCSRNLGELWDALNAPTRLFSLWLPLS